jgi:starch synthase (maltosyl-transferring)
MAGPRIYNLFPPLVGTVRQWTAELPRIARMRFNAVYVNPFHYPGFSGSLYAVKDYYRLNPRFRDPDPTDDETMLHGFTAAAAAHGLRVVMDLVVNHTSKDSELVARHPDWFRREGGELASPQVFDPGDPTCKIVWGDLAELDYRSPRRGEILAYFQKLVRHYAGLGFGGFRCDAAYKVPAEIWRGLIGAAKEVVPDILFCAENLGAPQEAVLALEGAGFDYLFNSVKWWDFESSWLLDQYESFRHVAPSIGFPESHDTDRLINELRAAGVPEELFEARYRQAYAFAATYSAGVMMPIGYEYGWSRRLDVVAAGPIDREPERFDLGAFIAEVNRIKEATPALNTDGPQRLLTAAGDPLLALERRRDEIGERVLVVVNTDPRDPLEVDLGALLPGAALSDLARDARGPVGDRVTVEPIGFRVLGEAPAPRPATLGRMPGWRDDRIVIESVYPELDAGRWPVKRVLGDRFEVWADIFRDGHDRLRAVVKYRCRNGPWREAPAEHYDNDRWVARFRLDAVGLWQYRIEAWTDRFESWRDEVEKKREAGQPVALELIEGRAIVEAAAAHAGAVDAARIRDALDAFDRAEAEDPQAQFLLAPALRAVMGRSSDRADAVSYERTLEVVVDRKAAIFAAWYEMLPRSQGSRPGRGGTFADCIARLPEIARLGFDVVYLPPIHPIGRVNRKGRNNSTTAEPGDPGSPYAIGSEEGGHCAVHPELGTLEDFRRFAADAAAHGIEIALDFAVQCAPDHPWVAQHPEWFRFRPDGTIKYAENPPKKYEDIVNVDFDNPGREALWQELRDVVLFWVEQGVRTFRVDNPHTKPLPFWQWLIGEVKRHHPEVLFLSEAFTRPKMMHALAKAGFSQSYTYFTWRNTKAELSGYLSELMQFPSREYFRPNFFTNTPDILPVFLQEGGRPAFRIRLALAATLSGAYGIYNGFELCENRALPGREEYCDSEKYEYKVWDWNRRGHIKEDIATVNRFRHDNPAMQELLNLRFLDCPDPDILAYARRSADGANTAIILVNLDPRGAHEAEIELPLTEWGLAADAAFALDEAFSRTRIACRGARQRFRLDPETSPASLFRLTADASR